jgi:hypothetical protein
MSSQVLVAAFAVSGYCSTYFRAGSKPFNPVLGETYECIREDKGFRFFSEQVSEVPIQADSKGSLVMKCPFDNCPFGMGCDSS